MCAKYSVEYAKVHLGSFQKSTMELLQSNVSSQLIASAPYSQQTQLPCGFPLQLLIRVCQCTTILLFWCQLCKLNQKQILLLSYNNQNVQYFSRAVFCSRFTNFLQIAKFQPSAYHFRYKGYFAEIHEFTKGICGSYCCVIMLISEFLMYI